MREHDDGTYFGLACHSCHDCGKCSLHTCTSILCPKCGAVVHNKESHSSALCNMEAQSTASAVSEHGTGHTARDAIGLQQMNLMAEAASWYLLFDLKDRHPLAARMFDAQTAQLDETFTRYAFAACYGELRHLYSEDHLVPPLDPAVTEYLRRNRRSSRSTAFGSVKLLWEDGERVMLMKEALRAFRKGHWRHGYGGMPWATIAEAWLRRAKGEDSAVIWVDSCWSLQHNSTVFLDKAWLVSHGLQKILDYKMEGRLDLIAPFAKEGVRALWEG